MSETLSPTAIDEIVARLERQRVALKQLRKLYEGLHERISRRMQDESIDLPELAKRWNTHPKRVQEFLERDRIICKGNLFQAMIEFAGSSESGEEVKSLGQSMPERMIALAHASEDVINTYIDLHIYAARLGSEMNIDRFSQQFGDQAELVAGLMRTDRSAIKQLELLPEGRESSPLDEILELLTGSELKSRVDEFLKEHRAERSALGEQIRQRVNSLRGGFDQFKDLARHVGVSETSLRDAMSGTDRTTVERQLEIIELLKDGRGSSDQSVPQKKAADSAPPSMPASAEGEGVMFDELPEYQHHPDNGVHPHSVALKEAVAGMEAAGQEVDGVTYVLTPENFKLLRIQLVTGVMASAVGFLQGARATLNLLMQTDDERLRQKIRADLLPEVEETLLTIEAFLNANPSALTRLNQERRSILRDPMNPRKRG